jgi:hypothetical protein
MQSTTSPVPPQPPDHKVQAFLSKLRWSVRAYMFLEGLGALVLWLGGAFLIGWLIDYGPVFCGGSEMPRGARATFLVLALLGASVCVWWFWLRRLFVPLPAASLALAVERRYPRFEESLVTSVEMHDRGAESPLTADLLRQAEQRAHTLLDQVALGSLFHFAPLLRYATGALVWLLLLSGAARLAPSSLALATERLMLWSDNPWPRFAQIEMVGVEVSRTSHEAQGIPAVQLPFTAGQVTVGRGSNVRLKVRAATTAAVVPKNCVLRYVTADGQSGALTMKPWGRPQDGFQLYVGDTKPLAGILSSLDCDVVGYDHRLRGYRIEVVESPAVSNVTMDLQYPAYMVDEQRSVRLPRTQEPVRATNSLPQATQVVLHVASSKPLAAVKIRQHDTQSLDPMADQRASEHRTFDPAAGVTTCSVSLGSLAANRTVEFLLVDQSGVIAERWFRVFLSAVPDDPPRCELNLQGIGSEITPDVQMPLAGSTTDDYGVARAWLDVRSALWQQELPLALQAGGALRTTLDFRQLRAADSAKVLVPGEKLQLIARAHDHCDLQAEPNVGASEQFVLEVVTAEKLLAGLEAREIALRRRLEQIVGELTEMRDTLLLVKPGPVSVTPGSEPGGSPSAPNEGQEQLERQRALRLLRVQRGVQQLRKSQPEVLGVAESFLTIRAELINNRVDTPDREARLQNLIAQPLQALTATEFPQLEQTLTKLELLLDDASGGQTLAREGIAQTNELLAKLEQILQKMLKLESYNEILELVRGILRDQEALREETRRQQKRELEE